MRSPRLDFPGARQHVMNRGARRAPIFVDPESRLLFLDILSELPRRFGVRVHGYALMPTHYHLMLESVSGNLPRAMRHLGGEYTRRINRVHRWDGPLFRGRYHNRLVDTDPYWMHLLLYLHLGPVRAGLSSPEESAWTSHRAYTGAAERPDWLVTEELRALYGSREAYQTAYQQLHEGRGQPPDDFDEERLWAPGSKGTVDVPDLSEPMWSIADAVADVSQVTGSSSEEVLTTRRGPGGNPANWLAAWWMSRHCGIDHGTIARALGTSHSGVSKRIRRIEDRKLDDPTIGRWVALLLGHDDVD